MSRILDPFRFVLIAVGGWMNNINCRSSINFAKRTGFYASNWAGGECVSTTATAVDWPPRLKD